MDSARFSPRPASSRSPAPPGRSRTRQVRRRPRGGRPARRLVALAAVASLVTAGAVTAMTAPAAVAAEGCSVEYDVVNEWQGGYQAGVTVTNLGDPVASWDVTWEFGSGQGISQAWNARVTQSGSRVTASNVAWNGSLGTGRSANFGFIGTGPGAPVPGAFTMNGVACTGDVGSTPTPTGPDPTPTGPGPGSGGEFDGSDCDVSGSGPGADPRLPDPFLSTDGSRITHRSDWRCRRAETKKLAEDTMYGTKPGPPDSVTGTVTGSSITVNVSDGGRSTSFSASVETPGGSGPFPAVVVYGGFGGDTATILSSGAAVIRYDPLVVGQEGTSRGNKSGAFYDVYGSNSGTGLLVAWGWGVSRIIDVIEADDGGVLDPDSFGVTGCSRYGKGAFVAGAFDQRIDLTMPVESGAGGAPIMRGLAQESGAQSPSSAYGEQPWLGDAFGSYQSNVSGLPLDTHQVIGMIAPRGLFLMENPHIDWLGAGSGATAALAGREIYRALGEAGNISYVSAVSDGNHCANRSEWVQPMRQHLQASLFDAGQGPGDFRISPSRPGDLDRWRDWTTPSLS
ncbi:cellulose-binding domain-containing protein [Myceligenerans pegani]|uniref:cellulose-binding domain-containing protein n=1 Tax=Myceligenerans pegani TaxID=2776917 RepID=UPI001CF09E3A|nr:cellulose-binding domain-containing protein [Myceligenerans sp. TRM 65318]